MKIKAHMRYGDTKTDAGLFEETAVLEAHDIEAFVVRQLTHFSKPVITFESVKES